MATTRKRSTRQGTAATGAGATKAVVVHATDETFAKELRSGEVPVLVDFSAAWCGPCKGLGRVLPAIAERFAGRVKVVKIDVDESPRAAAPYVGGGVPTLVLFKRGEPVALDCGFDCQRETEAWLEAMIDGAAKRGRRTSRRPTCCCG